MNGEDHVKYLVFLCIPVGALAILPFHLLCSSGSRSLSSLLVKGLLVLFFFPSPTSLSVFSVVFLFLLLFISVLIWMLQKACVLGGTFCLSGSFYSST